MADDIEDVAAIVQLGKQPFLGRLLTSEHPVRQRLESVAGALYLVGHVDRRELRPSPYSSTFSGPATTTSARSELLGSNPTGRQSMLLR